MTGTAQIWKPRLVFFQWDHSPNAGAADYLRLHMEHHVKTLATHFDVVVVNHDCDYDAICDLHEPDLTLFESGYRTHGSRQPRISNTSSHQHIPKLGLHNGDPWCDRRAGFISDMDRWGIETFFAVGTLTPSYTPDLADQMFVWPNAVDADLFRDYGQHKTIPVTLTGQCYGLYPWRQRVFSLLRDNYPCLVSPQHAYESKLAAKVLSGESYARALNASFVVPTCGTEAGEFLRKHVEIPAARACLVTERSDVLDAAGFVDMVNCVFADEDDVLDKLELLFSDRDQLQRITDAGHALVHGRHTLSARPQIYQWFMLQRELSDDERIIQPGPFDDLIRVSVRSGRKSRHIVGSGPDRSLLKQGETLLRAGRIDEAQRSFRQCLDFVAYLPEAKFGLALCALRSGRAAEARDLLVGSIEVATVHFGAANPDPVEWAYFLLALLGEGRLDQARRLQDFYPGLSHRELGRMREVIRRLGPDGGAASEAAPAKRGLSVHVLPMQADVDWFAGIAEVLDRCGQAQLAARLRAWPIGGSSALGLDINAPPAGLAPVYAGVDRLMLALRLSRLRPNVPPLPEFHYPARLARSAGRPLLGPVWRSMKRRGADMRLRAGKLRRSLGRVLRHMASTRSRPRHGPLSTGPSR